MNSAVEMQKIEHEHKIQKAKAKVIEALGNDPVGLSIAQLMTICKLSIKTVKSVLEVIEVDQQDGVYFMKSQSENKPAPEEKKVEIKATEPPKVKVIEAKPVAVTNDDDSPADQITTLLTDFPEGLTKPEIIAVLKITDKQFANSMYRLTKSRTVERIGKLSKYTYKLVDNGVETLSEPEVQPKSEIIEFSSPVMVKVPVPEDINEFLATESNQIVSVMDSLKSLIQTQVVQTQTLQLTQSQIAEALLAAFDFDSLEWSEDGGVVLSKIQAMVA